MAKQIIQIAVPAPLRRAFDYECPADLALPGRGQRVRVPFGRRNLVGLVVNQQQATTNPEKIRPIQAIIDDEPVFPATLLDALEWAAAYYHHPIGEVIHAAMPQALRAGQPVNPERTPHYQLTELGRNTDAKQFTRAPAQQKIWQYLRTARTAVAFEELQGLAASSRAALNRLVDKQLAETAPVPALSPPRWNQPITVGGPDLLPQQQSVVAAIDQQDDGFSVTLIHGITGSGKTEVYFKLISECLERGQQVLMLVPEIGLTSRLIKRLQQRFTCPLAVLHSRLTDRERHHAWSQARHGAAGIVLGTRSAVFVPLRSPGLFILDEEHDSSFKQQEGFRYHARDFALVRAQKEKVPVILGSATPSLETLANCDRGRYQRLVLDQRIGPATLPPLRAIDLKRMPTEHGLSVPLRSAIEQRLNLGEQSLIFINRRGYSPVLFCSGCGWISECARCDARLTYYHQHQLLRCHHCGHQAAAPAACPECEQDQWVHLGHGTQRLADHLARFFPHARVLRIDRDTTRRKGALDDHLSRAESGDADILVGTQLLAKGHDFPRVTLVGIIDADQGFYSCDFRSIEQMFQQIIQVAGRAGRADRPGEVLIQTWYPDNPLLDLLARHDYSSYATAALAERKAANLPPYTHLGLLRAEAVDPHAAIDFLNQTRALAVQIRESIRVESVEVMSAVPAPMQKRAGRYRAQLLFRGAQRSDLHHLLENLVLALERRPGARKVRWSLDVDPQDMY